MIKQPLTERLPRSPWARFYLLWALLSIGLAFVTGGWQPENQTRALVLLFAALLWICRAPLQRYSLALKPGPRFVLLGCLLAAGVEAFHMISEPVFASLRITYGMPLGQMLSHYLIDLCFTLPAYGLIFSLIWWFIQRFAYSFWQYLFWVGLGQCLGDGGLAFFMGAPALLAFLPYPMSNYHAMNVLPYAAVRSDLPAPTRRGGWLVIPALIVLYFGCGVCIQLAGKALGYV